MQGNRPLEPPSVTLPTTSSLTLPLLEPPWLLATRPTTACLVSCLTASLLVASWRLPS